MNSLLNYHNCGLHSHLQRLMFANNYFVSFFHDRSFLRYRIFKNLVGSITDKKAEGNL